MQRALLVVAVALAATSVAGGGGQAGANFSGRWKLVSASPARPGYEQFWLGTEVIVTQTANLLETTRVAPMPERTARFNLDGSESHNEYTVKGQREEKDSRATWNGASLLISTDTTPPDGRTWLSNIMRWSLDPDGTLVVGDTEICGRGECPSVVTALKFKKQE
jgi:hypothetical protein